MKLFSTDLRIYATAYVWANDQKEAVDKLRTLSNTGIELAYEHHIGENLSIDGRPFTHLDRTRIHLSPAMTIDKQLIPITMVEEVELEPEAANDVS
jgi:hypothetical protein